ncbi:hypothetical protein MCOR27_008037 [Pyricularia oryzae]|uniref:Microtubule associated protein n=4 Tax=Pyricularia TaxID=48558 RepID=A0ABQ8N383_PYRGI|nr:uncharacterized protein MGG_05272 [Pyricularia oryzae 70-15]KAH8848212.1 hypothetical protein MCOR01_001597 [Pyricularia oryzae]KAI6290540.1 hypothetical protein MCOR33_011227 [Pyricularia grisea]EHA53024.1 hypothetical protein MGG_05272 [Pyricularia oryzae 70-15]KAH9429849.1 hypothetical protein MCOR02_009579 [Pyricularia oryzae]KAI6254000.1 hypothetical protein MCOR19_009470 [Pyricularia oryzae]
MDASYLSQQVNTIIDQLHGLFDEIGVPSHERESRETELFSALSDTLQKQVRSVNSEKKAMVEEAQRIITIIRQMEASLDDSQSHRDYSSGDDLKITYPLTRCLQGLKEKHQQISKLHKDRFEQVKKLVVALESYSSHLESSFVKLRLPPTGPNQSIPPDFDLSPSYVQKLDDEFTRVYEEYTRRVTTVKAICEHIISLWAELGTPQAQTDGAIVKYYRDAPEQLGLHEEDIAQLRSKRDKLAEEKKSREKRLRDLKAAVEALWEKLGIEEHERKKFLNANRGCGVRQINEFEDELGRLNELKRQNLHLFVEDARFKLQELWDALYLCEDEMLEFTPAFSDVYSDALLEAHEREISRLEALKEQRAPILALVERHRSLVTERDDLAASSQDASRLMMKGQKGERRDPGKLLREEKMRKRIAKELPKITVELRKGLEKWEDEWGRDFLVHGERYLDVIEASESKPAVPPRSKTPGAGAVRTAVSMAGPAATTRPGTAMKSNAPPSRTNSSATRPTTARPPSQHATAKTPTTATSGTGTLRRAPQPTAGHTTTSKGSPSRIPARAPLSNLKHGNNSPERPRPESRGDAFRNAPPLMRAPPPKMRDLVPPPEARLETPPSPYRREDFGMSSNVRQVETDDIYDDRNERSRQLQARTKSHQDLRGSHESYESHTSRDKAYAQSTYAHATYSHPPRQISNTSTAVSGSENWETYDDNSEPEADASDSYYEKMRAARGKRMTPEMGYARPHASQAKRPRGLPPGAHPSLAMVDPEGTRIVSGSEWTDEDGF